jgi:hypothetical protein
MKFLKKKKDAVKICRDSPFNGLIYKRSAAHKEREWRTPPLVSRTATSVQLSPRCGK